MWIIVDVRHTLSYVSDMATQTFSIRMTDEERQALERAAQADDRPVSSLARKIISDWLRKQSKAPKR
jgi:predicted transcriptional regulator